MKYTGLGISRWRKYNMRAEMNFIREHGYMKNPRMIQMEITNACPLHCPQCYKDINNIGFMKMETFYKIKNEVTETNVKSVVLIGGEPMIHKNIKEMIEELLNLNLEVCIFTSGWGIDKATVAFFKLMGDRLLIMLSVNGSNALIHEKSRDDFQLTQNTLELFKNNGYAFGLNWVARHDNVVDFPNMILMLDTYKAKLLNVVCNKIGSEGTLTSPLTKEDFNYLSDSIQNNKEKDITIQKCYDILYAKTFNRPKSLLFGCQAGISFCSVTYKGEYCPCLHLNYVENLMSLKDYWQHSSVLQNLRHSKNVEKFECKTCLHSDGCQFCKAMSQETHDNFAAGLQNCQYYEESRGINV